MRIDHREELLFDAHQRLITFIQHPFWQKIVAFSSHERELEFVYSWEHQQGDFPYLIKGTIDLLCIDSQRNYCIVDYKTGTSGSLEDVLEKYGVQLYLYALATEQAFGTLPQKIYLAEVSTKPEVHEIDLTAEFKEQIQSMIKKLFDHSKHL